MTEDQTREREEYKRVKRMDQSTEEHEGSLAHGSESLPSYPASLLADTRLNGRGNEPVRVALMRQMQQTYGNRAVQRFLQRKARATAPASNTSSLAPVQRHAEPQAEKQFKESAQPEIDEQAQQAVAQVVAQGQGQKEGQQEDQATSVQTMRAPGSILAAQRAPIGGLAVQPQKKKSSLDKDAQDIVDYAQNTSIAIDERAKNTLQKILDKYYSSDKSNVARIEYDKDDPGLTTSWDPPASNPTPFMKVGDTFVNATTAAYFSRKVLQVGHEMQHVRQFKTKTPGLGPKFRHEREFLAFYWEATTPTMAGTGHDMSHKTRVDLIDAALGNLCCLPAGSYAAEKKALLDLRAQHDGKAGNDPTSPPTTCKG